MPSIKPPPQRAGIDEPVLIITWERVRLCDWYALDGPTLTYCPHIATHCVVYADAVTHYRCGPHATKERQGSVYAGMRL